MFTRHNSVRYPLYFTDLPTSDFQLAAPASGIQQSDYVNDMSSLASKLTPTAPASIIAEADAGLKTSLDTQKSCMMLQLEHLWTIFC
jgi:hypothetical protein